MKFKKQISFNTHDCTLLPSRDGRLTITLGVAQRCELVMQALIRRARYGARFSHLYGALLEKSKAYTKSDVYGALKRLNMFFDRRLVKIKGKEEERYFPTQNAWNVWKSLPKNIV